MTVMSAGEESAVTKRLNPELMNSVDPLNVTAAQIVLLQRPVLGVSAPPASKETELPAQPWIRVGATTAAAVCTPSAKGRDPDGGTASVTAVTLATGWCVSR